MKNYITYSDFRTWRANQCEHPLRREPNSVASSYREEEIRLAQLQFPGGQRIDDPYPSSTDNATRTLIYISDGTVFGACLTSGPFVARPNLLTRHGPELRLIEIVTQGAKQREWQHRMLKERGPRAHKGRSIESSPPLVPNNEELKIFNFDPNRWKPAPKILRMEKSSRAILEALISTDPSLAEWERAILGRLINGQRLDDDPRPMLELGPSLNVKSAAREIGISRSSLYEMLNRGEVLRTRLGKIPRSEIERLRQPVAASSRSTQT
jgi:hypothetical protein